MWQKAGLLIFGLIIAWHYAGPTQNLQAAEMAETTYERVLRTQTIRCAYISWQPYSLKNPNRPEEKPEGTSVDIMEAATKKLGLKIDWAEEIGWGNIGEGFRTNRYDAVCTQMWPDAAKRQHFRLSTPLFLSDVTAYKTKDSTWHGSPNSPATRIAVIDGALSQNMAEEIFPNATLVRLPPGTSSGEYYLTLTTGKADLILSDADEVAASQQPLIPVENLGTLPHVFAFPNEPDSRFKDMLNIALEELVREGFMAKTAKAHGLKARAP